MFRYFLIFILKGYHITHDNTEENDKSLFSSSLSFETLLHMLSPIYLLSCSEEMNYFDLSHCLHSASLSLAFSFLFLPRFLFLSSVSAMVCSVRLEFSEDECV